MHGGVPCSSFVWLSSSRHLRSEDAPLGNVADEWAAMANIITARFLLLVCLALVPRVHWTLENPRFSALQFHPGVRQICSLAAIPHYHVWWQLGNS